MFLVKKQFSQCSKMCQALDIFQLFCHPKTVREFNNCVQEAQLEAISFPL